MVKNIKINNKAARNILSIAKYLEDNFSVDTADRFIGKVYDTIDKIVEHPTRGRKNFQKFNIAIYKC
jgi:plasmid stabilization system protein ParE